MKTQMDQASKEKLIELECSVLKLEAQEKELSLNRMNKRRTSTAGQILVLLGLLTFIFSPFYVKQEDKDFLIVPCTIFIIGLITWIVGSDSPNKLNACKKELLETKQALVRLKYGWKEF